MKDKAEKLITKYLEGTCSEDENTLVEAGFLNDYKAGDREISNTEIEESCHRLTNRLNGYLSQDLHKRGRTLRRRLYLGVAAAAAIAVVAFYYNSWQQQDVEYPMEMLAMAPESQPGKNGATITLSDGTTIALSEQQSGVMIGANSLTYPDGTVAAAGTPVGDHKLTASTAKGQTYHFTLPDGTKVWLNAASQITIPQPYGSNKREIFLRGEAYFEVAKLKDTPFIVKSKDQKIEVLGTHFNVKAYPDLQKRTTLLEGKIQIAPSDNDKYTVLAPGQEALLSDSRIAVRKADTEASVSWVSGLFNFDGKSFQEIMQEVSDWYNLEIVYESQVPKGTFFGQAYKSDNLATVLRLLESAQLQYKVTNERKLIIKNKEKN